MDITKTDKQETIMIQDATILDLNQKKPILSFSIVGNKSKKFIITKVTSRKGSVPIKPT